jgi:alkanesulfonate monooxygenase SsuD/methylene tetrahydromethanopterin reductase-like flavin-dependent oxidoreductase (luciferase family)
MEIGIYTFGELTSGTAGQRMRDLLEEIELADQVGLDVFGVGEHHRPDFVVSAPAIVLAAAARTTKHIRLTSAVSVISSDDPIRVFQDFATVDLISAGRAEIMAGRGSFIESFGLFGFDLDDYDTLFATKLERLLEVRSREDMGVFPRPEQDPLPVWIAVGGNPPSAARAGLLGLPMALAIIGGAPERFAPLVQLYRNSAIQAGHDLASHELRGANFVGSPDQIVEKILFQHEIFKHDRFLLQMSVGTLAHADVMRAIELLGTEVAPKVRAALAPTQAANR